MPLLRERQLSRRVDLVSPSPTISTTRRAHVGGIAEQLDELVVEAQQPEQEVLRADVIVTERARLVQREHHRLPSLL